MEVGIAEPEEDKDFSVGKEGDEVDREGLLAVEVGMEGNETDRGVLEEAVAGGIGVGGFSLVAF